MRIRTTDACKQIIRILLLLFSFTVSLARQIQYLFCLLGLISLFPGSIFGQGGFADQVDRAFGSNQELVNGIQFSNQYIRTDGHPYWIDGGFKTGAVCINDQWFDDLQLRYNLYSQKLELGYLTTEGFMNQIITVPENISAFFLKGHFFERMQIGKDAASYYQVYSTGDFNFYIRWNKELLGGESTGSRFDVTGRDYWMQNGENRVHFKDKHSYLAAFPSDQKKAFKKLLKKLDYSFKQASVNEMLELLDASIQLLEEGGEP